MEIIIRIILGTVIFSVGLWLSLQIVDRGNSKNAFGTALMIGFVFSIFGGFLGGLIFLLPLVAFLMILIKFYDLGFIRSFLVVILMGVFNFLVTAVMGVIVGFLGLH